MRIREDGGVGREFLHLLASLKTRPERQDGKVNPRALSAEHQEEQAGTTQPQPWPEPGKHTGFWWAVGRGCVARRPGLLGAQDGSAGGISGSGRLVGSRGQEGSWDHRVRRAGVHRVGELGGVTSWSFVGSWGQEGSWDHVSDLLVIGESRPVWMGLCGQD